LAGLARKIKVSLPEMQLAQQIARDQFAPEEQLVQGRQDDKYPVSPRDLGVLQTRTVNIQSEMNRQLARRNDFPQNQRELLMGNNRYIVKWMIQEHMMKVWSTIPQEDHNWLIWIDQLNRQSDPRVSEEMAKGHPRQQQLAFRWLSIGTGYV
jgi:hypothetical protein